MYKPAPTSKTRLQNIQPTSKSGVGLVVLIPTRGQVSVECFTAVLANCGSLPKILITADRQPIVTARNHLWRTILLRRSHFPFEKAYVLWADSDSFWQAGVVSKMLDVLKSCPQIDLLSGAFCNRVPFSSIIANRTAGVHSPPSPGLDCTMGEIVEVEECGFHFVMHRIELLDKVAKLGANPFDQIDERPEDFSFCQRLREAGGRIFCATGAVIAHIDPSDGIAYVPGDAAHRVEGNELRRITGQHLVPKAMEERSYGLAAPDA
jgi:hypothetical protein